MSLDVSDARELFAQECRFPAERTEVIAAVGDTTIEPPSGDGVDIGTILERSEETEYESVTELYNTLQANLDDDHIGRKHYDDRSSSPERGEQRSI